MVARTGVLQGEAASANVRPARYACRPAEQTQIKVSKSISHDFINNFTIHDI